VEQGLQELSNKRTGPPLAKKETALNSLVAVPPGSPLSDSFFNDPFLLILPDLISSNTFIPFL